MKAVFIAVLLMSLTGAALYLPLLALRPVTRRIFSASWHYGACVLITLFLLVPVSVIGGPVLSSALNKAGSDVPQLSSALTQALSAPDDAAGTANNLGQKDTVPVQSVSTNAGMGQDAAAEEENAAAGTAHTGIVEQTGKTPGFSLGGLLPYLPFIWPIGAAVFITVQSVRQTRFIRRLRRTSLAVEDQEKLCLLRDCLHEMGIDKKITLMSSAIVTTPMLAGLHKCVLILPEVEMSGEELRMVFRHELTHLKRRDIWVKLLALVVNAVHWFNPLAYRLRCDIDTYCELSCDERVVSDLNAEERRFYGETILNVLCRVTKKREGLFAAFAATRRGFEKRLLGILDFKKASKRAAALSVAILFVLGLLGCAAGGLAGAKMEKTNELTVCIDTSAYGVLSLARKAYDESNPDVRIKYVLLPDSSLGSLYNPESRETMLSQMRTQVMAGEGPDLFILQSDTRNRGLPALFQDPEKAMRGGVFCDVLPLFQEVDISMDDFIAPVMEAGQVGGKQYIVPLNYQVFGVMTNDTTREILGDGAFQNPAEALAGIRAIAETPVESLVFADSLSSLSDLMYNPYNLMTPYPVDYDAQTALIDTPLLREVLETSKYAVQKGDVPIADQPELTEEFWKEYVRSAQYFTFRRQLDNMAIEAGIAEQYAGYTPHLEAFPSDDGGVHAEISLYAGIRANSGNKLNAVNLLKTLLSQEFQAKPNDGQCNHDFGWPVRKGVLAEHMNLYVDKGRTFGIGYSGTNNGAPVFSTMSVTYTAPLTVECVNSFLAIESKVTSAAFQPPLEIREILRSYAKGETDLDTTITRMQEYWDKSLGE